MAFPLNHHLFYSWAGWPSEETFPPEPPTAFFGALGAAWKLDGLELRSRAWTPEQIQMTFQAEPQVAPVFLAAGCCLMGENIYAGTFSEYGVGVVMKRT